MVTKEIFQVENCSQYTTMLELLFIIKARFVNLSACSSDHNAEEA